MNSLLNSTLTAALSYADRGWQVFALKPGRKTPATQRGFRDATVDKSQIEAWFASGENNIGIATGSASGLVVIDVDDYKQGGSYLTQLQEKYGLLPDTFTVSTRAGGRHLFFEHPGGGVTIKCSNGKVGHNIDIKADGGYVVAEPSFVEEDEKGPAGFYEILDDVALAELPELWIEFLAEPETPPAPRPANPTNFPENPDNVRLVMDCLSALDADCDRDKWRDTCFTGGALVHLHGWRYETVFGLYDDWSRTAGERYDKVGELPNFLTGYDTTRADKIDIGSLFFRSGIYPKDFSAGPGAITDRIRGGDLGNAELFAELYRSRIQFVSETQDWLKFDEITGWTKAPAEHLQQLVKNLISQMYQKAGEVAKIDPEASVVKKLRTESHRLTQRTPITNMLDLAAREPGMSASLSEFDRDGMLLGVGNGVIDLKTQIPRPYSPDLLVTKRCNAGFDKSASCPVWLEFLDTVQADPDVQKFLQCLAGLIALGVHRERAIFFLYGIGANGKSVFIETLAFVLGDYAKKIPTDLLMSHKRNPQGASPEMLVFKGVRLSYSNETSEGAMLDEARVKDLTGGDTLSGRPLYSSEFVSFEPSHTLVMVGNHRPVIRDSSNATWDRMQLIPFETTIPEAERDKALMDKLKSEASGILNWILAGVRMYLTEGLAPPQKIREATRAYEDEQDIVGEWISENCVLGNGESEEKRRIRYSFDVWCRTNGYQTMSTRRLTQDLEKRGITRSTCKRLYRGIGIQQMKMGGSDQP